MSLNIKPLGDRVVVEAAAAEEKTASGIIIPDTAKEKPQVGTIVAVGPGRAADTGTVIAPTVKVGDKVLYGKYAGTETSYEGKEYLIMRESDIYAVL
ncbi:co-chaperone GroES [Mucilaginibacter paludis]|uniref:Co-chaperonin GroES n=1 Tax=Mucilaginibacter paludis DSM 18603 TaxID=714943 RepID=H1Y4X2_9SPHI|nr:co-chaperone GroES [Mucilaginibacter paludis]EHQ28300.1 10 kDa chaperonin [Mucilaginibacter paludis DSM 18603]